MRKFPAGFMRGDTSKGLMFPEKELPARGERDDLSVRCVGRCGRMILGSDSHTRYGALGCMGIGEETKAYYVRHGRLEAYKKMEPKSVAWYDGCVYIDLSTVECTIAMPMHPSNTFTIHELQANAADILHQVQEEANKQIKGARMDLMSKLHSDGSIWVDQGELAGCSGGTFDNIVAAADILRGRSCGNGAFSLSIYPGSMPAYAVKPDGTVTEFAVSTGKLTEAERQIIADGCLINYYRNN